MSCAPLAYLRPLWLQTRCCGQTLWAYNAPHLDFLESYVRADFREGMPLGQIMNLSLASRLPQWMILGRHREEVLRGVMRLRERLDGRSAERHLIRGATG